MSSSPDTADQRGEGTSRLRGLISSFRVGYGPRRPKTVMSVVSLRPAGILPEQAEGRNCPQGSPRPEEQATGRGEAPKQESFRTTHPYPAYGGGVTPRRVGTGISCPWMLTGYTQSPPRVHTQHPRPAGHRPTPGPSPACAAAVGETDRQSRTGSLGDGAPTACWPHIQHPGTHSELEEQATVPVRCLLGDLDGLAQQRFGGIH